jgi:hypothetical protein
LITAAVAAACAICLITYYSVFASHSPAPMVCQLSSAGPVHLIRRGQPLATQPTMPLYAEDHLTNTADMLLTWPDGSQLTVAAASHLIIKPPLHDVHLQLISGSLHAKIVSQQAEQPFRISTTNAAIHVRGTTFHLTTDQQHTRCELYSGRVRLLRLDDQRHLDLQAQQTATVAHDTPFVVQPLKSPDAVPPVQQLSQWMSLFPQDGLTGWHQQYGTWTHIDQVVHGSDRLTGGKARLLSQGVFLDLELTCQLQIHGCEYAEVQVGDYNWYAEVPAQDGAQVSLRVLQHGPTLTITADGKPLPLKPGTGLSMRPGPIAFYVMPGGSISIRNAQFRVPAQP